MVGKILILNATQSIEIVHCPRKLYSNCIEKDFCALA